MRNFSTLFLVLFGLASMEQGLAQRPSSVNPELRACLDSSALDISSGGTSTTKGCDQVQHPFRLFQSGPSGAEITGLYDLKGVRCTNVPVQGPGGSLHGTGDCQILVQAWWQGNCMDAPVAGLCKRIKDIKVDYKVSQLDPIAGMATIAPVVSGITSTTNGQNRPSAVVGLAAIANGSASAQVNCQSIYPNDLAHAFQIGVDASGNPICGPDPNQQLIAKMQTQICQLETAQVNATGGETTTCNPKVRSIRLYGNQRNTDQCLAAHGSLVDLSGNAVANPSVVHNQQLFCRMHGSSCGSWVPYLHWSTTTNKVCPQQRIYHHCPAVGSDYYDTSTNSCGSSGSNYDHNSGLHSWSNQPIETVDVPLRVKTCAFACSLSDQQDAGNYHHYACDAVVSEVGCY